MRCGHQRWSVARVRLCAGAYRVAKSLQIGGLQPFGELSVGGVKVPARLAGSSLGLTEAGEAHGCAQLPNYSRLTPGPLQRAREAAFSIAVPGGRHRSQYVPLNPPYFRSKKRDAVVILMRDDSLDDQKCFGMAAG